MTNVEKVYGYLKDLENKFVQSGLPVEDFMCSLIGVRSYAKFQADKKDGISSIINSLYTDLGPYSDTKLNYCVRTLEYIKSLLVKEIHPSIAELKKLIEENFELSNASQDAVNENGKAILTALGIHDATTEDSFAEQLPVELPSNPFGLCITVSENGVEVSKVEPSESILNVNTFGDFVKYGLKYKFLGETVTKKNRLETAICSVLGERYNDSLSLSFSLVLPKAYTRTSKGFHVETPGYKLYIDNSNVEVFTVERLKINIYKTVLDQYQDLYLLEV